MGGLGPEATVNFLSCILRKTSELYSASLDQNHIHTIVELNPKVPNRNYAIYGTGEDCGPSLMHMSENLVRANSDFVVCACNTAHAFEKDIVEGCGDVPFVSMIEVTSNQVLKNILSSNLPKKCGILGGGGCVDAGLFQKSLKARGIEPVTPCKENQDLLQNIIYRIKAGDKGDQVIDDFIVLLKELKEGHQCSQIILGCTELPIISGRCLEKYEALQESDLVDSCEVMVEAIVRIAKGDLEIREALEYPSPSDKVEINGSLGADFDLYESTQPSEDAECSPQKVEDAADISPLPKKSQNHQ